MTESSDKSKTMKQILSIMNVNCRSVKDKRSDFIASVDLFKPDVILGTESWLEGIKPGQKPSHDAIKSSEIFPPNYVAYRNDRNRFGGGVFILIHKDIISNEKPEYTTNCEIEWVNIKLVNKKVLIGCFYMPHRNQTDADELQKSLQLVTNDYNDVILGGDFNCPDIDWDELELREGAPNNAVQKSILKTTIDLGLTQIHHEPTRDKNILDLIFTSNPSLVKSSKSVSGISDHAITITDLDVRPEHQKSKPRYKYVYKKANWDMIKQDIKCLNTKVEDKAIDNENVQQLWDSFKSELFETLDKNIPKRLIKSNHTTPWMTQKIKKMLKRKQRLYNKAKKSNEWDKYKSFQKEVKRQLRTAERDYINSQISEGLQKNDQKPFWKYIKSRNNDNIGVPPLNDDKGILISDNKEKAEILSKQFQSVFTKDDTSPIPNTVRRIKSEMPEITINEKGVEKLLKAVSPTKASGPDNIPNRILKECASEIAPILTVIFQKSIDSGELPHDWRDANISCIYKKGNKNAAENYRPVSLTSVSCKILEHIICKHMLNHFDKHNVLTDFNHGFRSGFSCETQLLITMDDMFKAFDKHIQIDTAILDFSKAFDTVSHRKLLHKLDCYGIRNNIHNWMNNFLTKRTMRVVVGGESSDIAKVESGVPQGTVLGPILFLCFINDLPDCVDSSVRLFADDCLLYGEIHNDDDQTKLQEDLNNLEKWAADWNMKFNAQKCYIMPVNKKKHRTYELCKHQLEEVKSHPYLGVQLSNDMKWSKHIANITKKANSTLGFLRRNLKHCPKECRKNAYMSMVRSTLEYGSIVWDPYQQKDVDQLEKVQRKGVRFIQNDFRSSTTGCVTKMMEALEIPTLQERRHQKRLTFLYKIMEGKIQAIPPSKLNTIRKEPKRLIKPKRFENCIATNIVTNHAKANSRPIEVDRALTKEYRNSFFIRTAIDWNNLNEPVVHMKTVDEFRKALSK